MNEIPAPFDEETWRQLPGFFDKLPEPVHLVMWGEEHASDGEQQTAVLGRSLAEHFAQLVFSMRPRRVNYPYYPVIGVMADQPGDDPEPWHDFGVRIIGWPAGYQLTSLITAIQMVSFRGMTLEAKTRIQLSRLNQPVTIEILTTANNEQGALVAQAAFGMAVVNPQVRTFLVMADLFREAALRYSVRTYPHTVINGRIHVDGVVEEADLLKHIAEAL